MVKIWVMCLHFLKKMQSQALSGFWGRDDGKEDSINLSLSPGH